MDTNNKENNKKESNNSFNEKLGKSISVLAIIVSLILFFLTVKASDPSPSSSLSAIIAIIASALAGLVAVLSSRMRKKIIRKRRIFIIYAMQDKKYAEEIVKKLKENGFNPWFDHDEVLPGQRWEESMLQGISESAVAIYLSSEQSNNSIFVSSQLKRAMSLMESRDKSFSPIVPIRIDDSNIPEALHGIRHIDIKDDPNFEQLNKGLNRILGQA